MTLTLKLLYSNIKWIDFEIHRNIKLRREDWRARRNDLSGCWLTKKMYQSIVSVFENRNPKIHIGIYLKSTRKIETSALLISASMRLTRKILTQTRERKRAHTHTTHRGVGVFELLTNIDHNNQIIRLINFHLFICFTIQTFRCIDANGGSGGGTGSGDGGRFKLYTHLSYLFLFCFVSFRIVSFRFVWFHFVCVCCVWLYLGNNHNCKLNKSNGVIFEQ